MLAKAESAKTMECAKLILSRKKDTSVFVVNVRLYCLQFVAVTKGRTRVNVS